MSRKSWSAFVSGEFVAGVVGIRAKEALKQMVAGIQYW